MKVCMFSVHVCACVSVCEGVKTASVGKAHLSTEG